MKNPRIKLILYICLLLAALLVFRYVTGQM